MDVIRRYGRQRDDDESLTNSSTVCCCYYGWVVWAITTIAQCLTFFGTSGGITFIVDPIKDELELSRSSISLSYTFGTVGGALLQVPIGKAVDRFGGRVSITICSACYALSSIGLSLPRSWFMLTLAFGCIRALGFGGLQLASTTCLQQWFVKRRGFATGAQEALSSIAGFGLCSLLLSALVEGRGWRTAYVYIGLAELTFSPLAALLLRSRPEDIGLAPDGVADSTPTPPQASSSAAQGLAAQAPKASVQQPAAAAAASVEGWTLSQAARTLAFWIVVVANAMQWGMGAGFYFHLASISTGLGMEPSRLPSCFYLPWAAARAASLLVGGWVLDRFEPRWVLGIGFL